MKKIKTIILLLLLLIPFMVNAKNCDNGNVKIKANTEKEIELKVVYNKEVDENKFVNGVYTDNQDLTVSLSNDNVNTNPITKTNYVTIILFVLLMIQLIFYFAWTKKTYSRTLILILTILLIPISTNALCKVDMQVESKITLYGTDLACVRNVVFGCCFNVPSGINRIIEYNKNMTKREFFEYVNNMLGFQKNNEDYRFIPRKYDECMGDSSYKYEAGLIELNEYESIKRECYNNYVVPYYNSLSDDNIVRNSNEGCYEYEILCEC